MSFKNLLTLLRSYPEATPAAAVEDAVDVAVALGAHLSALCIAAVPKVPRSPFGNLLFDISALVGEQHQKAEAGARRLLADFSDRAARKNVFAKQILRSCEPKDFPSVLAGYTRLHDLTIVPMPEGSYLSQFDSQWYAEAVIFDSGHPAIILPHARQGRRPIAFANVLVAWDQSRAAARAIADSLPILRSARSTLVVTVAGEKHIPDDHAPEELLEQLGSHGIQATHRSLPAEGRHIGEVLTACALSHAADLVVMGAYGRSRLTEFVLGGATKSLMTRPPVPLFLSH